MLSVGLVQLTFLANEIRRDAGAEVLRRWEDGKFSQSFCVSQCVFAGQECGHRGLMTHFRTQTVCFAAGLWAAEGRAASRFGVLGPESWHLPSQAAKHVTAEPPLSGPCCPGPCGYWVNSFSVTTRAQRPSFRGRGAGQLPLGPSHSRLRTVCRHQRRGFAWPRTVCRDLR